MPPINVPPPPIAATAASDSPAGKPHRRTPSQWRMSGAVAEGMGSAEEGLRRTAEELGLRLCRRIDGLEESLERSFERTLEAVLSRMLGTQGDGPELPPKAASLGLCYARSPPEERPLAAGSLAWLLPGPDHTASASLCTAASRAQHQLSPGSGCTEDTEANDSGAKSGERTEPLTPCSMGSAAYTSPDAQRSSNSSATRLLAAPAARLAALGATRTLAEHCGQCQWQPAPLQHVTSEPVMDDGLQSAAETATCEAQTSCKSHGDAKLSAVTGMPVVKLSSVLHGGEEDQPAAEEKERSSSGSARRRSIVGRSSRIIGAEDCCNSMRSSVTSIAPHMWPKWCAGPEKDPLDGGASQSMGASNFRAVDIRVRLSEMEAKGLNTNGSFLDVDVADCNFDGRMSVARSKSWLQRFILHPTSTPILIWHIIGPVLLAYDIIMIPMKAFPLPDHLAFDAAGIVVTAYWTLDTIRGFFTGFETDKSVEMRPGKIAQRYLRSWFALDAMTCVLDWTFIFVGKGGMFNKFWRTTRAVQAWKILRMVRLVRVVKMMKRISALVDQVCSIQMLIAIKSLYIAFVVGFICHYMACYWFLIGDINLPVEPLHHEVSESWLKEYGFTTADITELYSVSFHWALAQSGFAPTDIYPVNNAERTFATGAAFLWLIIVSITINLLNMWLIQLREANADRESMRTKLRKYLEEHGISRKLAYKVLRCFRMNYKTHRARVHEEDIGFLRDLPLSLKVSLRKEVFMPTLRSHIFFQFLGGISESLLMMISHLAMQETHHLAGENAYMEGTPADQMIFISTGRLDYYAVRQKMRCTKLLNGDWACEPALWLRWTLKGRFVTVASCEVVGIDVEKFQAIIQDTKARGEDIEPIKKYAVDICLHFMEICPDTDLWRDFETMQRKAEENTASAAEDSPRIGLRASCRDGEP